MRTIQPNKDLLQAALPLAIWKEAEKQAQRSPLFRFRTGAAIWHPSNGIVSTGAAHHTNQMLSSTASVHAEHHALQRASSVKGSHIAVVTISNCSSWAHSACPCYSCAKMLEGRGIAEVHYALWSQGKWTVVSERPSDLLERAESPRGKLARKQRIPLPTSLSI